MAKQDKDKTENEILHQRRALAKKAMAIFATRN